MSGEERRELQVPGWASDATWVEDAPGGSAVLGWSGETIGVWDATTGREVARMWHDREVVGAIWVKDALGTPAVLSWSYYRTLRLWELSGAERLRMKSEGNISAARWIEKTPWGPAILSWSIISQDITLWDAATGEVRTCMRHDARVNSADWIADACRPSILSSAEDRTIRLWDATTGAALARLDLDTEPLSLAINSAHRPSLELAVGCYDGSIGVLDLEWRGR